MNAPAQEDVVSTRMRRLGWAGAFLLFVLMVVMGYSMWRGSVQNEVIPMPVLRQVPDFRLTDQTGAEVTRDSLRGKVWVTNFFFTRCSGPCPLLMARMAEFQKALERAPEVALVSFTVDPEYDTPEVLSDYAGQWQADPERWKYLTGDPDTIRSLVTDGFMQVLDTDHATGEPVHGTMFMMVDGNGMVRGLFNLDDPELLPKMLMGAGNLLREQGTR